MRIEVLEKYEMYSKDEPDWDRMGVTSPKSSEPRYSYRRTYIDASYIERPIEIPGNKKEFVIMFWSGDEIVVKGDYDLFCLQLNDIEEGMFEDEDFPEQIPQNQPHR